MDPIYLVALIIGVILLVLLLIQFAMWCQRFSRELRYLNKEINRTTGAERERWQKRKKQLWLSLIPFIRK